MREFCVNDIVEIIESGHQYDKYSAWAKDHGFYDMWSGNQFKTSRHDRQDDEYVVRVVDWHNKKNKNKKIYGIKNLRSGEYHIISAEGIELKSRGIDFGIDHLFEEF